MVSFYTLVLNSNSDSNSNPNARTFLGNRSCCSTIPNNAVCRVRMLRRETRIGDVSRVTRFGEGQLGRESMSFSDCSRQFDLPYAVIADTGLIKLLGHVRIRTNRRPMHSSSSLG